MSIIIYAVHLLSEQRAKSDHRTKCADHIAQNGAAKPGGPPIEPFVQMVEPLLDGRVAEQQAVHLVPEDAGAEEEGNGKLKIPYINIKSYFNERIA